MCVYSYWLKSVDTSFGCILLLNQQPQNLVDLKNICLVLDLVSSVWVGISMEVLTIV